MGFEISDRGMGFSEDEKAPELYFVDGAPGTGKSYVYNKSNELIAEVTVNKNSDIGVDAKDLIESVSQVILAREVNYQPRSMADAEIALRKSLETALTVPIPAQDNDCTEQPSPAAAEYILRFVLEEKDREIVLGDLYETYERVAEKSGKRRADLWICYEVARSVWPLVRRLIVRITGRIVRVRRAD
jgi:hypothetical protein